MKYKLIAIDLDDTLLNDSHQISQYDLEMIRAARNLGIKLSLITGRNYEAAKQFLDLASFEDLIGCLNGAYVVDPTTEQFLFQFPIEGELCSEMLKDIERANIHVNLYHGHKAVSRERNHLTDYYKALTGVELEIVGILSEYAQTVDAGKILLIDEPDRLNEIKGVLEQKYNEFVHFTFSKPRHLEVNSIHASKGNAVKTIAKHYGVLLEEVIAIGNDENDISMLEYAGVGIAMDNASDKVKKHAEFITRSNNQSGVGYAINKYLFSPVG